MSLVQVSGIQQDFYTNGGLYKKDNNLSQVKSTNSLKLVILLAGQFGVVHLGLLETEIGSEKTVAVKSIKGN